MGEPGGRGLPGLADDGVAWAVGGSVLAGFRASKRKVVVLVVFMLRWVGGGALSS